MNQKYDTEVKNMLKFKKEKFYHYSFVGRLTHDYVILSKYLSDVRRQQVRCVFKAGD